MCLLWFRVLERIGARALVAHVRTFADFLVYEFSTSAGGQQLNKCIEILNDMVWKYNIVTLDRLILCLVSIDPHETHTHGLPVTALSVSSQHLCAHHKNRVARSV